MDEIVNNLIEVKFPEKDDFLKIRETLTRIGVASRKGNGQLDIVYHQQNKRGWQHIPLRTDVNLGHCY